MMTRFQGLFGEHCITDHGKLTIIVAGARNIHDKIGRAIEMDDRTWRWTCLIR